LVRSGNASTLAPVDFASFSHFAQQTPQRRPLFNWQFESAGNIARRGRRWAAVYKLDYCRFVW
jgi:hypothetical protein